MKILLKCEYRKTRRRFVFLTALVVTGIQLCWVLYGKYDTEFILESGWMSFLYQLPVVNAMFLPILCIIVASRMADLEYKGDMLKQLCVIIPRGALYDAKLLYGFSMILFCILLSWSVTILFGYGIGFAGGVPVKYYLLYLLFTAVPTMSIYIVQHTLSMLFRNQAVGFFVGVIGSFLGVFSMFLPQLPMLRRCLPWGYYGVLQFVGMFGWTKETRWENAYFAVMNIDWLGFCLLTAAAAAFYLIGRNLFAAKEM